MNLDNTLVVLGTCVQFRLRLSDVLMDMRAEELFSAHWTENIDDEFLRNMVKIYGIDQAGAEGRLRAMKARCPEAYDADPDAITRAVLQAAKDLKKPPYTVAELLYVLKQEGAKHLVSRMSKALEVEPVAKEDAQVK
ncbi:MAG: hypothetical protein QM750_29105 [Rubrivivax sp.]